MQNRKILEQSNERVYNIDDLLVEIPFVKSKKRSGGEYANYPCSFDIETTSFYDNGEKRSTMYVFVLYIGRKYIIGRTWDEFMYYINRISQYYELNVNRRLIIFIHNLEFEFQFLRKYFQWVNVFSLDTRKPIYALTTLGVEFRCSYILSNFSLAKLAENLIKHKVSKLVGELDYSLMRHSYTKMTEKEIEYVIHDGLIIIYYIEELLDEYRNITEIPITNTGFVRNTFRKACYNSKYYWGYKKLMNKLTITVDEYKLLKEAFSGGFTHANALFVGKFQTNIGSLDFNSSYPAVMVTEKFPMSKAREVNPNNKKEFITLLNNYCCLFQISFDNIIATTYNEHYISRSKCVELDEFVENNGRIVRAKKLTITITEQDYSIIEKMYKWDRMSIGKFYVYKKAYLPKPFIETLLYLYKAKTELKGVEGKEIEYMRSKNQINSSFGMAVTDPARDLITYIDDWGCESANLDEVIKIYNTNKNRFLFYPWGVWVTAYARKNLFTGIEAFGDDYRYSDTDSIKAANIDKHMDYITNYNKIILKKLQKAMEYHNLPLSLCMPKTKKDITKTLGVWEFEGIYDCFKTLGAKRYCYSINGVLHITIAGVSKEKGSKYLMYKYGTAEKAIEEFKNDIIFPAEYEYNGKIEQGCGKLLRTYIDFPTKMELTDYNGFTSLCSELSSIHLEPTSYELSLTDTYIKLLKGIQGNEFIKRKI